MHTRTDWFSHDIRNRLTVALGFVRLIRQGRTKDDPEKQERYLDIVDTSLNDALRLVDRNDRFTKEDRD